MGLMGGESIGYAHGVPALFGTYSKLSVLRSSLRHLLGLLVHRTFFSELTIKTSLKQKQCKQDIHWTMSE